MSKFNNPLLMVVNPFTWFRWWCMEQAVFTDRKWYADGYWNFSEGKEPATCCRTVRGASLCLQDGCIVIWTDHRNTGEQTVFSKARETRQATKILMSEGVLSLLRNQMQQNTTSHGRIRLAKSVTLWKTRRPFTGSLRCRKQTMLSFLHYNTLWINLM